MLSFPLWHARFRDHMQMAGWAARTVRSYLGELRRFFVFLESRRSRLYRISSSTSWRPGASSSSTRRWTANA